MIGLKFGNLLVLRDASRRHKNRPRYVCACDCGAEIEADHYHLKAGHTKSCGCAKLALLMTMNTTHGLSKSPEYKSWTEAKARCNNESNGSYRHYGGRGIRVCGRWTESFEAFIADMGKRPTPQHSLDRIDVNGDYSPSNCRWATPKEQQSNRRDTVLVELDGERMTATEASRRTGVPQTTFMRKLRAGTLACGSLPQLIGN